MKLDSKNTESKIQRDSGNQLPNNNIPYKHVENEREQVLRIGRLKIEHWQAVSFFLAIFDYLAIIGSYFIALWLRFDGLYNQIPHRYMSAYVSFTIPFAIICLFIFYFFHMYNSIWQYASFSELIKTVFASILASILHSIGITFFFIRMPMAFYLVGAVLQLFSVIGIRFAYRLIQAIRKRLHGSTDNINSRVMLIGAGSAGQMILRDMRQAPELSDRVVCIIDDNPNKWNRFMDGIPVVGGRDDILYAAKKYNVDKIFLAIPSASAEQKRDILTICNETGCELKQLPGMYQFVLGALCESFDLIPINGAIFSSDKLLNAMTVFLVDFLVMGFTICLPVFVSMLLLNAILGVLAKVSPQLNMFAVGIQLKILIGIMVMFITVGMLPSVSNMVFGEIRKMTTIFMEALT